MVASCASSTAVLESSEQSLQELADDNPDADESRTKYLRELLSNTGKLGGTSAAESIDPAGVYSHSTDPVEADSGGDLLVAPIPFLNPTIGVGLALGVAYLVPLSEGSPPSTIGGGLFYSDNGTRGVAGVFKGYFDEDRYRVAVGLANMRVNYDLAVDGLGNVPLQQDAKVLGLEFLVRVAERIFFGPQILVSGLNTKIRQDDQQDAIDEEELDAESVALGFRAQRDTRDSTFYPREGSVVDLQLRAFDEGYGSNFTYQVIPMYYNGYFSPNERGVVAVRASARFATGDVPFYGESFFGAQSDLRGYTVGTLHDQTLIAVQAEYRRELFWRVGGVAFGGVGALLPNLSDLDDADALPSAGFGLRVTLEEVNHVNFRLDFAWGDGQSAIYFGVGEAF